MIQSFISIYPSRLDIACLCIHYNLFIPEILSERIGHDIFHNLFTRRIGINTIADPRRIKRINIRRDIIRIADIPQSERINITNITFLNLLFKCLYHFVKRCKRHIFLNPLFFSHPCCIQNERRFIHVLQRVRLYPTDSLAFKCYLLRDVSLIRCQHFVSDFQVNGDSFELLPEADIIRPFRVIFFISTQIILCPSNSFPRSAPYFHIIHAVIRIFASIIILQQNCQHILCRRQRLVIFFCKQHFWIHFIRIIIVAAVVPASSAH